MSRARSMLVAVSNARIVDFCTFLYFANFNCASAWYTLYAKHTSNGSYGAALGAMYEGDIDYMLSGLFFTLARWTYISPVMTLCKFRYVFIY